jgi:predicted AAA+ superfamily ATPase
MVRMKLRERYYGHVFQKHLKQYRQMLFVSGARQVGKTTCCRSLGQVYLDWDNESHREIILKGPQAVAEFSGLDMVADGELPVIIFDELHKYSRWKLFLKGFFDTYESSCRILLTGSSRLDVYQRGGDSLMGRYFPYHMHPFSLGELTGRFDAELIKPPHSVTDEEWNALLDFGGFPEPFINRSAAFSKRWRDMRRAQLLKEDIRDLTRIRELDQLAVLEKLLSERSGEQLIYSTLGQQVRVSENTVRSWVDTLGSLHHGFLVRPWHRNINKALRKEPKWYLRDWSGIADSGKRAETMVACHLLKAVEAWADLGLGDFELRYLRDKQKREVDFVVIRDGVPWFLVEVKNSDTRLSSSLAYFKEATGAPHAFQVVIGLPYVDADCFANKRPVAAPARTFLSQLV